MGRHWAARRRRYAPRRASRIVPGSTAAFGHIIGNEMYRHMLDGLQRDSFSLRGVVALDGKGIHANESMVPMMPMMMSHDELSDRPALQQIVARLVDRH